MNFEKKKKNRCMEIGVNRKDKEWRFYSEQAVVMMI